jgi:phospholipase C
MKLQFLAQLSPRRTVNRSLTNDPVAGSRSSRSGLCTYGAENEHPGYAGEATGSDHLVDLLKAVTTGPDAKDTLVVVTYDEFGGQWDHVPRLAKAAPPGRPRRLRPGDPHPGAVGERPLHRCGRGPYRVRHDVDPRHHRAQPQARPRRHSRRQVADLRRAVQIGLDD